MFQIIDDEESAGGAEYIRFKVYPSKGKPDLILGSWQYYPQPAYPKGPAAIYQNKLGNPAAAELVNAAAVAHEYGVPFILVDDPDDLFPPHDRPIFRVVPPCS
jgi:hypothetical protein